MQWCYIINCISTTIRKVYYIEKINIEIAFSPNLDRFHSNHFLPNVLNPRETEQKYISDRSLQTNITEYVRLHIMRNEAVIKPCDLHHNTECFNTVTLKTVHHQQLGK